MFRVVRLEGAVEIYTPAHVANFFLDRAEKAGRPITQLKLMKLVYIAHGWMLAVLDRPAFNDDVLAWKHGPVIRSLYDEFKHYSSQPIREHAIDLDLDSLELTVPRVPQSDADALIVLEKVWGVYSPYTASSLRAKTHERDTPWDQTYKEGQRDLVIDTDLIKSHFRQKVKEYLDAASGPESEAVT